MFEKLIKFEPIDITQIVVTAMVLAVLIVFFRQQLQDFFASFENRPISITMDNEGTTIELSAPAPVEPVVTSVENPTGNESEIHNLEERLVDFENIQHFEKLGSRDLYEKLSGLQAGDLGVIDFAVNDPGKNYFRDESMLRYLSIASEKIRFLAFYEQGKFVGVTDIRSVISGLASGSDKYASFGSKLKSQDWKRLPGIISADESFRSVPTIQELQENLDASGLSEVPLVVNDQLTGFLNYESIASELYRQAAVNLN